MFAQKRNETDHNPLATVYVGNLDEKVNEPILYELFLQIAPIKSLKIPKDRISGTNQGYAFVEFKTIQDVDYSIAIMNGSTSLYGKPIRVRRVNQNQYSNNINNNNSNSQKSLAEVSKLMKIVEVGANLYIGNMDELIDENFLQTTFEKFGKLISTPQIVRDEDGNSKGFGFVKYDNFESSDLALEKLNGQYLMNKPVRIDYAFKKNNNKERHGDKAERELAARGRKNNVF